VFAETTIKTHTSTPIFFFLLKEKGKERRGMEVFKTYPLSLFTS